MKELKIRPAKDFRVLLQKTLLERCEKNPAYSLRAYARALGVAPSALSEMIKGKRPITSRMRQRLGLALGLSPAEIGGMKKNRPEYQQLTLDTFAVISDWYHYAILELMKLESFDADAGWIASALGITRSEAANAVERLQRLGLIRIENGNWTDASSGFSTNIDDGLTSAGSRKLQRQILEQSIRAMMELPTEVRNHTSMTMAIDPERVTDAVALIKKFRRELSEMLELSGKPKEVYQLSISLFPVTKIENKGG